MLWSTDAGEVNDLNGGKCLDVKRWAFAADAAQHLEVVVEFQPRMQTTNDVHFSRPSVGRCLCGG